MPGVVLTERGPLQVVWQEQHPRQIQNALQELYERLFLESHMLDDGRPVWTVQEHVGERAPGNSPYRTVAYWTDERGDPKPLTWELVDYVRTLRRDADDVVRQTHVSRREHENRVRLEIRETAEGWLDENERRFSTVFSPGLPRSQSLRRSRDRERARGRRV